MPDAERSSLLWPTWAQVLATLGSAALPGQITAYEQERSYSVYFGTPPIHA